MAASSKGVASPERVNSLIHTRVPKPLPNQQGLFICGGGMSKRINQFNPDNNDSRVPRTYSSAAEQARYEDSIERINRRQSERTAELTGRVQWPAEDALDDE